MIGSSSAALTGLMFVVITLVTNVEASKRSQDGVSTFSTPTVMHFCAALYVSAIFVAPWQTLIRPSVLLGAAGLCGVIYVARITFRAKRLTGYTPDMEDWAWYNALPFLAYGAIFVGAIALVFVPDKAEIVIAAGVLLLVFIGIRNAWDVVTFLAIRGGGSGA
jgi:hypothetical protein